MNENQRAFEEKADLVKQLISEEKWSEAEELLTVLGEKVKESTVNEQLYFLLDSSIKLHAQAAPDEILATLKRALALTKPNLDFCDFRNVLLSIQEANILNVMVV